MTVQGTASSPRTDPTIGPSRRLMGGTKSSRSSNAPCRLLRANANLRRSSDEFSRRFPHLIGEPCDARRGKPSLKREAELHRAKPETLREGKPLFTAE